jgi:predicted dehydrogenase
MHLEYAVQKGVHVFMEKSFAVDGPGIRRVLKAGKEAKKKNLKIAGGLMSRHSKPLEAAIEQIHKGAIGDIITCWAYREHGPVGFRPRDPGMSELFHQIRNYSCFTWLNGSFILDWLIHNLDVCCWVKNAWPVSAQGHGGRQTRTEPDQLFDHYAVEYHFPDGTRLFAQGRHIAKCWNFFGDIIHGTRGSGVLGEGISKPCLYKSHQQTDENKIWEFKGTSVPPHQAEHDLRGHPPKQALQRNRAFRLRRHGGHPRPHGRRVRPVDHVGTSDGVQFGTGARSGETHGGFACAGDARRQRPLSDRDARHDTGVVDARRPDTPVWPSA